MPLSGLCIRQMLPKCTQSIHRDNTQSNDTMQSGCKSDANSQFVAQNLTKDEIALAAQAIAKVYGIQLNLIP